MSIYEQTRNAAENIVPPASYYINVEGFLYCNCKTFARKMAKTVNGNFDETNFLNFKFMIIPNVVQKDHKQTNITENELELRKELQKMILNKYKSISSFSIKHGFDKSDLSKFLKGTKDWQVNKFFKLLSALKSELTIHEEETPTKGKLNREKFKIQFDPDHWQKFMKSLKINSTVIGNFKL